MAANATRTDSRLVLRVETGEMKGDTPLLKTVSLSRIKKDASDDALLEAGNALASLQTKTLDAIRRVDTIELTQQA